MATPDRNTGSGIRHVQFCSRCRTSFAPTTGRVCPECESNLIDFLRTGHMGCEHCYDTFAPELNQLLLRSTGMQPVKGGYRPVDSGIARSRTEEIRDALLENRSNLSANQQLHTPVDLPEEEDPYECDTFLCSVRIRMTRNLDGIPYWSLLEERDKEIVNRMLLSDTSALMHEFRFLFERYSPVELSMEEAIRYEQRGVLSAHAHDRRIFSMKLNGLPVMFTLYSGDEDHIRIQWIMEDRKKASDFDEIMEHAFVEERFREMERFHDLYRWQVHSTYGCLASSPENTGAGIRLSVMIRTPAIYASGNMPEYLAAIRDAGFEVRGPRGEGSIPEETCQISINFNNRGKSPLNELKKLSTLMKRLANREDELSRISDTMLEERLPMNEVKKNGKMQ